MVTNNEELSIILSSVALEVRLEPGGMEPPYQRLLRFSQQLVGDGKRADLAEMIVEGGPNSITRADMVFTLWAGVSGKGAGSSHKQIQ